MLSKRAFGVIVVCLTLFSFSFAVAAERDTSRNTPTQTRLSPVERSVTPGPVSVPRILRDRLQSALRLMLELATAEAPLPPIETFGLSDDPDPTGMTSDGLDKSGANSSDDDSDQQDGEEGMEGSSTLSSLRYGGE